MLSRRIPPIPLKFESGSISLNSRITSQVVRVIDGTIRRGAKEAAQSETPLELIEQLHRLLDQLQSMLPQVQAAATDLRTAARCLTAHNQLQCQKELVADAHGFDMIWCVPSCPMTKRDTIDQSPQLLRTKNKISSI